MKKAIGFVGIALLLSSCNAYWSGGKLYKYDVDKIKYESTVENEEEPTVTETAFAEESEVATIEIEPASDEALIVYSADQSAVSEQNSVRTMDHQNLNMLQHRAVRIVEEQIQQLNAARSDTPPLGTILLWALLIVLVILAFTVLDKATGGILGAVLVVALILWLLFYFDVL